MTAPARTHCKRGHEFAIVGQTASRQCRLCARERDRERAKTPEFLASAKESIRRLRLQRRGRPRVCHWCFGNLLPSDHTRYHAERCAAAVKADRQANVEARRTARPPRRARTREERLRIEAIKRAWRLPEEKERDRATARRSWNRRVSTPEGRLLARLRPRVIKVLDGRIKHGRTMELLGCSAAEFRAHIERQFTPGMGWHNMGEWHVDHVVPCAAFDLSDPEQQRACFHYSNLRPLWAGENRDKSDLLPDGTRGRDVRGTGTD